MGPWPFHPALSQGTEVLPEGEPGGEGSLVLVQRVRLRAYDMLHLCRPGEMGALMRLDRVSLICLALSCNAPLLTGEKS